MLVVLRVQGKEDVVEARGAARGKERRSIVAARRDVLNRKARNDTKSLWSER